MSKKYSCFFCYKQLQPYTFSSAGNVQYYWCGSCRAEWSEHDINVMLSDMEPLEREIYEKTEEQLNDNGIIFISNGVEGITEENIVLDSLLAINESKDESDSLMKDYESEIEEI